MVLRRWRLGSGYAPLIEPGVEIGAGGFLASGEAPGDEVGFGERQREVEQRYQRAVGEGAGGQGVLG